MKNWNTLSRVFNYSSTSVFVIGIISLILISDPNIAFFAYTIGCFTISTIILSINLIRYFYYRYLKSIKTEYELDKYTKITFKKHIVNPVLIANFTCALVGIIIISLTGNLSLAYMIMIGVAIGTSLFNKLIDLYIRYDYKKKLLKNNLSSDEYKRIKNLLDGEYSKLIILCNPKTTLFMIIGIISLIIMPRVSSIESIYIYNILRFTTSITLSIAISIFDYIKNKEEGLNLKEILRYLKKELIDNSFNFINIVSSSVCVIVAAMLGINEHSDMLSSVIAKVLALSISIFIGIYELRSYFKTIQVSDKNYSHIYQFSNMIKDNLSFNHRLDNRFLLFLLRLFEYHNNKYLSKSIDTKEDNILYESNNSVEEKIKEVNYIQYSPIPKFINKKSTVSIQRNKNKIQRHIPDKKSYRLI